RRRPLDRSAGGNRPRRARAGRTRRDQAPAAEAARDARAARVSRAVARRDREDPRQFGRRREGQLFPRAGQSPAPVADVMTHLTSQQFVEALDGTLTRKAAGHLSHCDACRREVDTLRALMTDVESAREVPDPSPLFWAHFSERVTRATADLVPGRAAW